MKVELTSVKYAAFASRETTCFEAVVLIDGKRAMTVRNDGGGGGNWNHDIIPGSEKRLEEYALTLPEYEFDGIKSKHSLETMIAELLEDHMKRREMKRALNRCVHFKIKDKAGVWNLSKTKWAPHCQEIVKQHLEKKYPGVVILNALPEDEAIKLWGDN